MSNRWWAPAGAHIGPDASDLALLAPGGEARYDLGAALFALHRTGAAACEVVAASPIPDDVTLITNLATARLAVAPPLVECIAKCVDGGGSYAGLLVRDVVDDAEQAAVDLFNAAVAKGVAPPLAAQRVGMIYGVDSQSIGTYRTLACTPAANPVALADAADRALFSFVEKVCSDEAAQQDQLEEVSKDVDQRTRVATEPRTADGEWTKVPVGRLAPTGRNQRNDRNARNERNVRNERTVRTTGAQVGAQVKSTLKSSLRSKVKTSPLTNLKINLKDLDADEAQNDPGTRLAGSKSRWTNEADYHEQRLGMLGIVLGGPDSYRGLLTAMTTNSKGEKLFRGGALRTFNQPAVHGTDEHAAKIAGVAMAQHINREDEGVYTDRVLDKDVQQSDVEDLKYEAAKGLVESAITIGDVTPSGEYKKFVATEARDATFSRRNTDDTGWIVVYQPSHNDSPTAYGVVNEVMIASDTVRADVQPGRHMQILLDPNQVFKVVGQTETFDDHTQTKIITHVVLPVDEEEINKSWENERRTADGEWTTTIGTLVPTEVEPAVPVKAPQERNQRNQRSSRNQRNVRNQRNQRNEMQHVTDLKSKLITRSTSRVKQGLSAKIMASLSAGATNKPPSNDALIGLRDRYNILDPGEFNGLVKAAGLRRGDVAFTSQSPPKMVPMGSDAVLDWWFDHQRANVIGGHELEEELTRATASSIAQHDQAGAINYDWPVFRVRIEDPDDTQAWEDVGARMAAYMDKNPQSVQLALMAENNNDPNFYTVFTNRSEESSSPPPPVTLIVHDKGRYPDDADGLHFVETKRWRDLPKDFAPIASRHGLINPLVNVYRLVDNRDDGDDE